MALALPSAMARRAQTGHVLALLRRALVPALAQDLRRGAGDAYRPRRFSTLADALNALAAKATLRSEPALRMRTRMSAA